MRRLVLALLVLAAACKSTTPPAAPLPVPPPVAEARPYGLTLDEEALILRLEDRREHDKSVAAAWIHHENPLHRARMALALGRIGAATFDDANANGQKDPGEKQAGVDELASLVADANDLVRANAAFALGLAGDAAGVEPLLRFAADKDGTVAAEAVEARSKLASDGPFARYAAFAPPSGRARGSAPAPSASRSAPSPTRPRPSPPRRSRRRRRPSARKARTRWPVAPSPPPGRSSRR